MINRKMKNKINKIVKLVSFIDKKAKDCIYEKDFIPSVGDTFIITGTRINNQSTKDELSKRINYRHFPYTVWDGKSLPAG